METSFLIQDLTTIVVTASLVSIVFSFLKWPSILGYLLSGLIVGPYITSNFGIRDAVSVQSISELGVIFLMFCIGLEFDLKKLKQKKMMKKNCWEFLHDFGIIFQFLLHYQASFEALACFLNYNSLMYVPLEDVNQLKFLCEKNSFEVLVQEL